VKNDMNVRPSSMVLRKCLFFSRQTRCRMFLITHSAHRGSSDLCVSMTMVCLLLQRVAGTGGTAVLVYLTFAANATNVAGSSASEDHARLAAYLRFASWRC
jgi:hypothetical protein